jgi:dTDP-4-dehydrorhamnose 3,5-epimerase
VRFTELALSGAYLVELEPLADERGEFLPVWRAEDFTARGLGMHIENVSVALNRRKGTLRGMHYQAAPYAETKIVRCIAGAIFDVIFDLRPHSPTYMRHLCFELNDQQPLALWIPRGYAHGYQTLVDNTSVEYLIDAPYKLDSARGVRYDDPFLSVTWPLPVTCISDRDLGFTRLSTNADRHAIPVCASPS